MISDGDAPRDLVALVVPLAGSVQDTGDVFVPCRLADAAGAVVEPVSAFLAELQASGRSEATLKSYCKALLRWFRPVGDLGAVGSGDPGRSARLLPLASAG